MHRIIHICITAGTANEAGSIEQNRFFAVSWGGRGCTRSTISLRNSAVPLNWLLGES